MEEPTFVETFPPTHTHRTIVLCFDGTENKLFDKYSNVAKLFGMLDRSDRSKQLVYYQTCIGAYTSWRFSLVPMMSKISVLSDSVIASTIKHHAIEGYRYLMDNYEDGDRICIFGFSRGAHTARILVEMIDKVGLLPVGNYRHIKYAWEVFNLDAETPSKRDKAAEFKNAFAMDVKIEFVGIWDAIGSVEINGGRQFFRPSNSGVKTLRHALALDERRANFQTNSWRAWPASEKQRSEQAFQTDVEEVWFVGCHSDVGGLDHDPQQRHSLSRISLRWMIRQCFLARTGILFDANALRMLGLEPSSLYPEVLSRPPPMSSMDSRPSATPSQTKEALNEEEEDLIDGLSPINDKLVMQPAWWALEVVPLKTSRQLPDGSWKKMWSINHAHPRRIPCQKSNIKIHRTVQLRMMNMNYKPRAQFPADPIWVA